MKGMVIFRIMFIVYMLYVSKFQLDAIVKRIVTENVRIIMLCMQ